MRKIKMNSDIDPALSKAEKAKSAIEECIQSGIIYFQDQLNWLEVELDDYISGELDSSYADHINRVADLAMTYTSQIRKLTKELRNKINNLPD